MFPRADSDRSKIVGVSVCWALSVRFVRATRGCFNVRFCDSLSSCDLSVRFDGFCGSVRFDGLALTLSSVRFDTFGGVRFA